MQRSTLAGNKSYPNMVLISGGTFRMGSDKHYPAEAPVHRVTVDAFRIDKTPVTNRQFKEFVRATGHVTVAEMIPDQKDYPHALPHMLYAGSLVFSPPNHPVDLKNWGQWWTFLRGANWRRPYGPKSNINVLDSHPVVHVAYADALAPKNPRGALEQDSYDACQPHIKIPRKVLKGDSHLCAPNYCRRYRPAARLAPSRSILPPVMLDSGASFGADHGGVTRDRSTAHVTPWGAGGPRPPPRAEIYHRRSAPAHQACDISIFA